MAIFTKGSNAQSIGLPVQVKSLQLGQEYIFKYYVPPIGFKIFSSASITTWMNDWFNFKAKLAQLDPTAAGDPIITVVGMYVNTTTGDVFVRGRVTKLPPNIQQAGINPYAVFAVLALIFSSIGLAVTFMGVYEVKNEIFGSPKLASPEADPCTSPGILNQIKCVARKSAWVGAGIGVGVLLTLVGLLFLVGRSSRA